MKEDVLAAIATFATLTELITWLLIAAAAIGYTVIGWLTYRIVHLTAAAIADRHRLRRDLRRLESYINHPSVRRYHDSVQPARKEETP